MANISIDFNCDSGDGSYIETYLNSENQITVSIFEKNGVDLLVFLEKSKAIKFAKTLRTEINKIVEEGSNG